MLNSCGGIIRMGESREERFKMVFEIKDLGVKSVPLNALNPIKGTPLQNKEALSPIEIFILLIFKTLILIFFIIETDKSLYSSVFIF